jgi:TolB-like protein/tetratricopeptide (TPR) repeat protein
MATFSLTEFLKEARRRRVFRVAALYIVGAWVALQAADLAFPGLGIPESAIRYIWMGAILGVPVALFFGWRYDIIGGRIVRTAGSDVEADLSIRRADYVILAALSAVVAVTAFGLIGRISDTRVTDSARFAVTDIDPKSVAVWPFVNLSGNRNNEYFSDGLTETLLHALAQLPDLKVTARTSSFFFKGRNIDIREIAKQLGVNNVLEGSVQRDGNKVRIVAQLTEAETGFHLWSQTYDLEMTDIFEVQDDVANRVALAMKITLASDTGSGMGRIEVVGTKNLAAYEKYLKGLQQKNPGSNHNNLQAEISFKEALAMDPDYYEAMLQLVYTYALLRSGGAITRAKAIEDSRPFLDRLLEERPDNGLALALDTSIRGFDAVNVEKRKAAMIAAIEQTPNEPELYRNLALLLRFAGQPEEALQWLERGITVDPLAGRLHMRRMVWKMQVGDVDEAETSYARGIEANPHHGSLLLWGAELQMLRKEYAEWFAMNKKLMELDPLDIEMPVEIARRFYVMGLEDEADKYLQRAITISPDKAFVQREELHRQVMLGNYLGAREMSEAMLRDDIDDRFGTYWSAVMVFMSTMSELDKTDEALAVLEELKLGVSSPDFQPGNWKEMALQYYAVLALARSLPKEDTLRMLDAVVPRWDKSFPAWRDEVGRAAPIASARGQMDIAVELALSDLETGMAILGGHWGFFVYQYIYDNKALALQPAVAERLDELKAEAREAGEDIWVYIVENNLQL